MAKEVGVSHGGSPYATNAEHKAALDSELNRQVARVATLESELRLARKVERDVRKALGSLPNAL